MSEDGLRAGTGDLMIVGRLLSPAGARCLYNALMAAGSTLSDAELAKFRALAEQSLEDHRGVDISQIRDRLRLSPAERVARLVAEVQAWNKIRQAAGIADT